MVHGHFWLQQTDVLLGNKSVSSWALLLVSIIMSLVICLWSVSLVSVLVSFQNKSMIQQILGLLAVKTPRWWKKNVSKQQFVAQWVMLRCSNPLFQGKTARPQRNKWNELVFHVMQMTQSTCVLQRPQSSNCAMEKESGLLRTSCLDHQHQFCHLATQTTAVFFSFDF